MIPILRSLSHITPHAVRITSHGHTSVTFISSQITSGLCQSQSELHRCIAASTPIPPSRPVRYSAVVASTIQLAVVFHSNDSSSDWDVLHGWLSS